MPRQPAQPGWKGHGRERGVGTRRSKRKFYKITFRADEHTMMHLLRMTFRIGAPVDEGTAALMAALFASEPLTPTDRALFRMWKRGRPKETWPVLLQQEFTRLFGDRKHFAETIEALRKRRPDLTDEQLKAYLEGRK